MSEKQHLLSWLILIAILGGTYYLISSPYFTTVAELENTYVRKKQLLERLTSLPGKEKLIKEQLADLGGEAATRFLYQGEATTVQTYIQRDVQQIASNVNLQLNSMRPLDIGLPKDLLVSHVVQVGFSTTHEKLLRFMDELRRAQPLLKIKRMTIRVQKRSSFSIPAQLAITMNISGYRDLDEV